MSNFLAPTGYCMVGIPSPTACGRIGELEMIGVVIFIYALALIWNERFLRSSSYLPTESAFRSLCSPKLPPKKLISSHGNQGDS